jgi:DNA repair exonuclease SbcCD ATPase subunit
MTKQELQKELQEKVKEGIKPSDIKRLKRSKSADDIRDIPTTPPLPNRSCPHCPPLKLQLSKLKDQILQLRLDRLKDFSAYQDETKQLNQELDANVKEGVQEIEKLENKLKSLNKKKLELQSQLGQAQSKNARLELELIDEAMTPTNSD